MDQTSSSLRRCGRLLSASVTIILCIAVVALFAQVQVISYKLGKEHNEVQQLKDMVHNQQQDQIEQLTDQVKQEQSLSLVHMAGTFTLITCLLTMFHMSTHLRYFQEPTIQRKILAILWMSPIYALTSFVSLLALPLEGYLAVIKDFYEAYCIYMFLSFLVSVLGRGDRNVVVELLTKHVHHLKEPSRWFSRWYHPPPVESEWAKANAVLLECQILAMQFVFCRPLTSIASFVVNALRADSQQDQSSSLSLSSPFANTTAFVNTTSVGAAEDSITENLSFLWSPGFIIAIIQSVSVGLAFSGLLKFYHAVSEELKWCQPFSKFLCIKGVVFMTFWQGLVINIVVNVHGTSSDVDPIEKSRKLQNVLICLEMLFFSVAHWCTFPVEEWEEDYRPRHYAKPGIGIKDFVSDVSVILDSRKAARRNRRQESSLDSDHDNDLNLVVEEKEYEMPVQAVQIT